MLIQQLSQYNITKLFLMKLKITKHYRDFPDGSVGKKSACSAGDTGDAASIPGLGQSPGGGPTLVFLTGESHGQRSLVGYSPKGAKSQI